MYKQNIINPRCFAAFLVDYYNKELSGFLENLSNPTSKSQFKVLVVMRNNSESEVMQIFVQKA